MADRSRTPSTDPATNPLEKVSPQTEATLIETGNQSRELSLEPGDNHPDTSHSQLINMDSDVESHSDLRPQIGPNEPGGQTQISDSAITLKDSLSQSESTSSHRDDPAPTSDSQQHELASDGSSPVTTHLLFLKNSKVRQRAAPSPQHINIQSEVSSRPNEQGLPLEVLQEKAEVAEIARHPATGSPDAPLSLEIMLIVIGPLSDISNNTASASIPTEAMTELNPGRGSRNPVLLSATELALSGQTEVSSPANEQSLSLKVLQGESEVAEVSRQSATGTPDASVYSEIVLIVIHRNTSEYI